MECDERLKGLLGEEFQVATIGPTGENLVTSACVMHNFGCETGRTGIGAVLESKKVRAIAVGGSGGFPVLTGKVCRSKAKR